MRTVLKFSFFKLISSRIHKPVQDLACINLDESPDYEAQSLAIGQYSSRNELERKLFSFFNRYHAKVNLMDTLEAIRTRRSVRKYRPDPIPEELLKEVLSAARIAPSAENAQPWKFVIVTDEDIKLKLVQACAGQKFIAEAPMVIVGCGFPDDAYATAGGYMNSHVMDVTIAMDHLILAAASVGLGTCWIAAFKEEKVKDILGIPSDVRVVALTPLGFPQETPGKTSRKDLAELICYDRFE